MVLELCQHETHGTLLQVAWNIKKKKKKLGTASAEEENRKLAQVLSLFRCPNWDDCYMILGGVFLFVFNSFFNAILVPAVLAKAVSTPRSASWVWEMRLLGSGQRSSASPVVPVCRAGAALTQCGLLRVEITCQCAALSTAALNPISASDDADHESKETRLSCFWCGRYQAIFAVPVC